MNIIHTLGHCPDPCLLRAGHGLFDKKVRLVYRVNMWEYPVVNLSCRASFTKQNINLTHFSCHRKFDLVILFSHVGRCLFKRSNRPRGKRKLITMYCKSYEKLGYNVYKSISSMVVPPSHYECTEFGCCMLPMDKEGWWENDVAKNISFKTTHETSITMR